MKKSSLQSQKTSLDLIGFRFAWKGIKLLFQERNFRIHLFATFVVVLTGWLTGIKVQDWFVLLFLVMFVIICEAFNTAIERVVDLASPEFHPLAGKAKDIAAGAVLLAAILAIAGGLYVFLPYWL